MTVKLCDGYWMASGDYMGRSIVVTAQTRGEALSKWCEEAAK